MRLFVAVTLPVNVRSSAERLSQDLQQRLDSRVRVAWIPAEKMHLTVRFIGHVDDSRVPPVLEALGPSLAMAPFDIAFDRCGMFPRTGPPRVFWMGLSAGVADLQAMHHEFNRRLLPVGFAPEDRPYTAHLTLGRVKEARGEAARTARAIVTTLEVPPMSSRVNHATVLQSLLSPEGATYRPLLEIPCSV